CAVPCGLPTTVAGRVRLAAASTSDSASPSATPGARENDNVTDGSCPVWLTDCGPTPGVKLATVLSGISLPADDRTYSMDNASGRSWYSGATRMITWYSFVGA